MKMPVSKDTGIFCFSDGLLKNLDRHSDLKTTVAVIHQVLPEHRKRLPNTSCTSPFGVDGRSKHPVEAIALFGFDGSLLPLCS